ncbi:hypothetical protein ACFO5Q_09035 [Kordiimonas lipolytica]|uniref:Tetratricopeptide repeat-containing protein n=1 Tax=Kordiimonas lipolytica TaxID=1662421 RepID=A0ABV8UAZ5_9PROT|nr:hypothetical protein [Kordiimonas lipolytica]
MKKLLFSTFLTAIAMPALAQNDTVTTEHRPNEHTVACLEAPTRDCAFTSALQTVIGEEFGIERAKVLIGVARAMIETGQQDQAIQTLMLALDEARSVRLTLVTQEKITVIAPLLARAGDGAGALALAEELQNDGIRDTVLAKIAEEAISAGKLADARVALGQMTNQVKAFWRELSLLPRAPREALAIVDLAGLEAKVQEVTVPDQRYLGVIQLAIISDRMGRPGDRNAYLAEAEELFSSIVGISSRATIAAQRARSMFDAGMDEAFVQESYELALLHGGRLRNNMALVDFAKKVGVIEAARGDLETALSRLEYFIAVDEKAQYLASLRAGSNQSIFAAEMRELLNEVEELQGAYERDLVRLTLLEGALGNSDMYLARHVVEAMEDDDNQALALALMAPLLD